MSLLRNTNNRFLLIFTFILIVLVSAWQFGRPHLMNQSDGRQTRTYEPTPYPTTDLSSIGTPSVIVPQPAIIPIEERVDRLLPLVADDPNVDIAWQMPDVSDDELSIVYVADDATLWITSLDDPEQSQQISGFAVHPDSVSVSENNIYFRNTLYNSFGREHWLYNINDGELNQLELCDWQVYCDWATISPDGNWIASYKGVYDDSSTTVVQLYHIPSNVTYDAFDVGSNNRASISRTGMIMWSPDSSQVIALRNALADGEVLSIFDVEDNVLLDANFLEIPWRGQAPIVSDDGQSYIYGGRQTLIEYEDGVQVWATQTHTLLLSRSVSRTDTHRLDWYHPLDWHPNNQQFVTLEAWRDIETNTLVYSLNVRDMISGDVTSIIEYEIMTVSGAEFNADGSMLLISRDDEISVYNMTTGEMTPLPITGTHAQWLLR
ncbi:MAG: hypothetical protein AAFV93_04045 [Chloroflexota bacterium]